ncbi:TPA: hypothetical protein RU316_001819 [Legionella pneumophila]|nr:hypothetical protein [Legionella pneumophila]HDU8069850.1 hypothetical protein [Legionella pneumophila]HDZ9664386.1 hypothetical protein [Legionella pneumophila]HEL8471715.1 hypothetical protein [Legionella pneumophila]HEO1402332.1 hypothetical protein [Legionella pneumophila]
MKNYKKIYLDNNHLINLLDGTDHHYKELFELISKNEIKLLISDLLLIEQANVYKPTLSARAAQAEAINFSYLRSHKTLIKMEIANSLKGTGIKPETDNFFKVIKFPYKRLLSSKQKKLTFPELLKILPEKPLSPQNDPLYLFLNNRENQRKNLKQFILNYHLSNCSLINKKDLTKIDEFTCPSLFFYFSSWMCKVENSTKNLSRNDAFDSAHCAYVPYSDLFVTDRGNAHCIKQSIVKFNKSAQKACSTKILYKCSDLIQELR